MGFTFKKTTKEEAEKLPKKTMLVTLDKHDGSEPVTAQCGSILGAFATDSKSVTTFAFADNQPPEVIEATIDGVMQGILKIAEGCDYLTATAIAASLIAAGMVIRKTSAPSDEIGERLGMLLGGMAGGNVRVVPVGGGDLDALRAALARAKGRKTASRDPLMELFADVERASRREQAGQDTQRDPLMDFLDMLR